MPQKNALFSLWLQAKGEHGVESNEGCGESGAAAEGPKGLSDSFFIEHLTKHEKGAPSQSGASGVLCTVFHENSCPVLYVLPFSLCICIKGRALFLFNGSHSYQGRL